jgi:hypothetical protein
MAQRHFRSVKEYAPSGPELKANRAATAVIGDL